MKKFRVRLGIFLLPFVTATVILFTRSTDKRFAYHYIEGDCYNHGAWIYDRLYRNPAPVSMAFIGSSATIHSVNEEVIDSVLKKKKDLNNYSLCNLGYCRLGMNLNYVLTKDLVSNKNVKYLFLEVRSNEDYYSHPMFPFLAETKDVTAPVLLFNRDLFSDYYDAFKIRMDGVREKILYPAGSYPYDSTLYGYGRSDRTADSVLLDRIKKKRASDFAKRTMATATDFRLRFPLAYLEKILQLAHEQNIRVIFHYVQHYGSQYPEPQLAGYYKKHGELWIAPQEIFLPPENWMDENHLNDKGAKAYSEWLGEKIAALE